MNQTEIQRVTTLLAQIDRATDELRRLVLGDEAGDPQGTINYDNLDRSRRRRKDWGRRGRVFYQIARRGGSVSDSEFDEIVERAEYKDRRGVAGFFRGSPEPVLQRNGDMIELTERGRQAAAYYDRSWRPRREERRWLETLDQVPDA